MTAADVTPGQRPEPRFELRHAIADLLMPSRTRSPCNAIRNAIACSDSNPGDTRVSCTKLRISSPAPVSSITEMRHLGHHEPGSDPIRAAARAPHPVLPLAVRAAIVCPWLGARAASPKPTPVSSDDAECEEHHRPVQSDLFETRDIGRLRRDQSARCPVGDHQSDHTAAQRKHDRLGQQLAQQPSATRAHARPGPPAPLRVPTPGRVAGWRH